MANGTEDQVPEYEMRCIWVVGGEEVEISGCRQSEVK
jgi:hypothetical protein